MKTNGGKDARERARHETIVPGNGSERLSGGDSPEAAWFVKQPKSDIRDTASAGLSGGTLSVHHVFPGSSNLFKSDGVNTWVNQNANLVAWPVKLEGDFSVEATVRVTGRNKVSSTSGIGLGMFESFDPDAAYAFMLLTTSLTANLQYADGPGSVKAGGTGFNYGVGQAVNVTFCRRGNRAYWNMNPVRETPHGGSPGTPAGNPEAAGDSGPAAAREPSAADVIHPEQSADVSAFWKGGEPMYAGLAFGNVDAEVTECAVRGGDGQILWASDRDTLVEMKNASVILDRPSLEIPLASSAVTVTAAARALGGGPAAVSVQVIDTRVEGITATENGTAADSCVTVSVNDSAFPARLTVTPRAGGACALRVVNRSDPKKIAELAVCVVSYRTADDYGEIGPDRAYPAPGETAAYRDGPLFLEFDAPPVLNPGHSIKIFTADGSLADSIAFTGETARSGERELNVGDQLVRTDGNRLCIQPHSGALKAETAYYVAIPTTAITGTLNGKPFTGFSDNPAAAAWGFTTRAAPHLRADRVTVDPNAGRSGPAGRNAAAERANFRSLQAALDALETALPDSSEVVISLAPGVYHEPITYTGGKSVTIRGPAGNNRGDTCVIRWRNSNVMNGSNAGRASFFARGSNLRLENLTLENTWARKPNADNQAETLHFAEAPGMRNRFSARNCAFKSNQDTLQIAARAWFYDCYIEGNTDFIWGYADAALFDRCSLRCVNDGREPDTPLMVARTPIHDAADTAPGSGVTPEDGKKSPRKAWVGKGFVLKDSEVAVDEGAVAWFGRNAGGSLFYDQVALINVRFSGPGKLGTTLWHESAYYYRLGDASRVGWKSAGCSGLGAETATRLAGTADLTGSAELETEYATADQILNRVVVIPAAAAPAAAGETGSSEAQFADAPERWDLSPFGEA